MPFYLTGHEVPDPVVDFVTRNNLSDGELQQILGHHEALIQLILETGDRSGILTERLLESIRQQTALLRDGPKSIELE